MHMAKVPCLFLLLLCYNLCSSIKVPTTWDESAHSEVKNEQNEELPVEIIQPQNLHIIGPPNQQSIPVEYFEYTAQKPKFAAEVAEFHGVQNPQQHYKAYPVKPYTGKEKPALGIHHMLDAKKPTYKEFQNYVNQNSELNSHVKPTSSNYEIFHPYKAEEPALQEIYKDPVLRKIRYDLQDSKNRLQAYEQEAGEPNIAKDEYLESPEKTDSKLFPHKNAPARYEIHRPERRPIYYKVPPQDSSRNRKLNNRFKHPWNQHAKIRPAHYRPLHNHIRNLRQKHAMKYDDERNEYPQVPTSLNIAEPQDGYDIYEKGKQKYTELRNNLDESVQNLVKQNRPATFKKLELQNYEPVNEDVKDEFVPIKNYAQVRKTETYKHLPKNAAFDDAETYEEIRNAPRLREAVKSTKAQIVYSEEGYEDSAYDHAGEQKHASDHEGHGGFLKEHEKSGGLYKIPSVNGKYQDGKGSEYRDKMEHGEKWKNNNKDDDEETEAEDYSEDEYEEIVDANIHNNNVLKTRNRNKRQGASDNDSDDDGDSSDNNSSGDSNYDSESDGSDINSDSYKDDIKKNKQISTAINKNNLTNDQHGVGKREVNFKVPEINITSTLSFPNEHLNLAKLQSNKENENIKEKYPYYFKHLTGIHKNSPLRYAENLKFIPKKSNGGTEFYDSRSQLECSEVDEEVDPIPEKLKNGQNPTDDDDDEESESKKNNGHETAKKQPRLKGLGDKIDCFKAKYFGENPLDSPFFKEETISNPEPILAPKLPIHKLTNIKGEIAQESKLNDVLVDSSDKSQETPTPNINIYELLDKLRSGQQNSQEIFNTTNDKLNPSLYTPQSALATNVTQQANVYSDILKNIKTTIQSPAENSNVASLLNSDTDSSNTTYNFFENKEEVTKLPPKLRKKRATPFVYEPYKIIRDSQVQDSKKTTTSSNISPLIKQLQSSRVAERVSRSNKDDKQAKQKTNSRTYVDIGRKDRTNNKQPTRNENSDATFVDVSVDHRRGEPRYELRPSNHKPEYTPVENQRAMSVDAYKSHAAIQTPIRGRQRYKLTQTTIKPYHDVSLIIPRTADIQNVAASNTIKKTSVAPENNNNKNQENSEEDTSDSSEENSDEDYEDEDETTSSTTTTTTTSTTTSKPIFTRRIKMERSSKKSATEKVPEHTTEMQRLKLVTRFRNYKPDEKTENEEKVTQRPLISKQVKEDDIVVPKYTEKKKKSRTSTLVTDTKKYDENDGADMEKEEIDALIGVKHNMDEYMPMYEKVEEDKIRKDRPKKIEKKNNDDDDDEEDVTFDRDEDDIYDDDDDEDYDDEDEEEEEEPVKEEVLQKKMHKPERTTPEPTKRTLVRTTEAPPATVATRIRTPIISSRKVKLANKPIVTRKNIEIHKELPTNKSSPHVTQFKEDIKVVEIIKEMPAVSTKKLHKNAAALDLYKDDELAKAINNLGDVEIFRENLDLDGGPKHGGNYRKATEQDLSLLEPQEISTKRLKDAETSQSKNTKHVELDEYTPKRLHGGNLKSLSDMNRSTSSDHSAKLIELSDPPARSMHGGNLKYENKRRGSNKNEKLIELDDYHHEDNSSEQDDNNNSHRSRNGRMHGGNYRNAKYTAPEEDTDDIQVKSSRKNSRRSAAVLLNSFAQAVPILTSTPGYIVDPSKRMYYYVDA